MRRLKVYRFGCESVFSLRANDCSDSLRTGVRLGCEYAITGSELEVRDKVLWLINCMAGVDGHHIDNKSKWKFTDLSLVEEAIENDDKLFWGFRQSPEFFSISIEEV